MYTAKNYQSFKADKNMIEQCCAAYVLDIVVNNIEKVERKILSINNIVEP